MDDIELLEMAAKAVGYTPRPPFLRWRFFVTSPDKERAFEWNPLDYDCDALSLAVKLNFDIQMDFEYEPLPCVIIYSDLGSVTETQTDTDRHTVTRRAIVRAAAEIGKRQLTLEA